VANELLYVSRVDDEEMEVLFTVAKLAMKRHHRIHVALLETAEHVFSCRVGFNRDMACGPTPSGHRSDVTGRYRA
jgi:hypothetical protein